MKPADLILKWGEVTHSGDYSGKISAQLIKTYQAKSGYSGDAKNITHVAMYIGNGRIVHSILRGATIRNEIVEVLSGVVEQGIYEYFDGSLISMVSAFAKKGEESVRARLVSEARARIGTPYALKATLAEAMAMSLEANAPEVASALRRYSVEALASSATCSHFLFDTYNTVLGEHSPVGFDDVPIYTHFVPPAHFFVHPKLRTLEPAA